MHPSLEPGEVLIGAVVLVLGVPLSLLGRCLTMRTLGRVSEGVISRWSWGYVRVQLKADVLDEANEWLNGTLMRRGGAGGVAAGGGDARGPQLRTQHHLRHRPGTGGDRGRHVPGRRRLPVRPAGPPGDGDAAPYPVGLERVPGQLRRRPDGGGPA